MGHGIDRKYQGILFALASYSMYSFHYATMKWLGDFHSTASSASPSIMQLIFVRSAVMLGITLIVSRRGTLAAAIVSPAKNAALLQAVLQFLSMACFFIAERDMSLSEVTTLYTTAPLMIVVLSIVLLGERIQGVRWIGVFIGVIGTVIAAHPSGNMNALPTGLALLSALFWALAVVSIRKNVRKSTKQNIAESTIKITESISKSGAREHLHVQMLLTGIVFTAISGVLMTWTWPSTWCEWALMMAQGGQVYLALYCFFQACRFAPASLVGPLEYSSVVWAGIFGYLIFANVPTPHLLLGAALVAASGIVLSRSGSRQKAGARPM